MKMSEKALEYRPAVPALLVTLLLVFQGCSDQSLPSPIEPMAPPGEQRDDAWRFDQGLVGQGAAGRDSTPEPAGRDPMDFSHERPGWDVGPGGARGGEHGDGSGGEPGRGMPPGSDTPEHDVDAASGPAPMEMGPDTVEAETATCAATPLPDRLSQLLIPDINWRGRLYAEALPNGDTLIAWGAGDAVRLTRVDAAGERTQDDLSIVAQQVWGLAVAGDRWAVLVQHQEDILAFVTLNADGGARSRVRLMGGVPQDVQGNEWFGALLRGGRVAWTGDHFAAYYTVQRMWPDGVAHYGDQLRLFERDGSAAQMLWDWGCSHSMEMRLAHNGTDLAAVCSSDCYPSKGIHLNHRLGKVYDDTDHSNCAGRYGTSLGGLVGHDDGFWVAFTAAQDRGSADVALRFVTLSGPRDFGEISWLTSDDVNDGSLHMGLYGDALLVGWVPGRGDAQFVEVARETGLPLVDPIGLPGVNLVVSSAFFTYPNDDVGWVQRVDGGLGLMRLAACRR